MKNEYFSEEFLDDQRAMLLKLKSDILNHMRTHEIEDISPDPDQVVEEVDKSQVYTSQRMSMELRERELKRLHEIDEALYKLEEGQYGLCEETGEPIGEKRLQKIPWVRLSIEAQEDYERNRNTLAA
ncbi:TraR/DksA family transcriptional regulator [Halobacteriovorax sp. HLS]|uniref:TraR/DksA family transcriptional regulator n=1 Tax=Halobacteriovorax sp. HLS TaxID=2234000 RepID=UPI000FD83FDD|nr:TraR/DksA family transcriptional regulator [Halobacteriovorax sp. HLS]